LDLKPMYPKTELRCRQVDHAHSRVGGAGGRIPDHRDGFGGTDFVQQLDPLAADAIVEGARHPSDVSSGPAEGGGESRPDWITRRHDDRNGGRRLLRRHRTLGVRSDDHVEPRLRKLLGHHGEPIEVAGRIA
jgi:hypothetical protein